MGNARVINYGTDITTNFPVYGAGADIDIGTVMKKGATPGTDGGSLIIATGASANPSTIGILQEEHDYSVTGDTLVNGTVFVTHPMDVVIPYRVVRMEYDLTDTMAATAATTGTNFVLGSLEDNIDAGFLYVVSGDGIGQTNYITAATAGSCTLKAAFGTATAINDTLIKILPRFHDLASYNTAGTKIGTQAAAGAARMFILDNYIIRNGNEQQLSPVSHADLTGLNNLASLKFEADVAIIDSIPYRIA